MPDWTGPFKLPTFVNDKFSKAKAEYVAKRGYTITIPGLSDIIKYKLEKPMTTVEKAWWKGRYYENFTPERREEIAEMKDKRRRRYLSMMRSPTPELGANIGSLMTSFDDAQDALGTMAVVGRIAMHLAPRILRRAFAGPVSWLMTAADLLNLHRHLQCVAFGGKSKKRGLARLTSSNPFTRKARVLRAANLRRVLPHKGEIIEGLQTTSEVFGYGISLGPIVGLLQDLGFGFARLQRGEPVKFDLPIVGSVERVQRAWKATDSFKKWSTFDKDPDYSLIKAVYSSASKMAKSAALMFGGAFHSDDDELLQVWMATYLSTQALMTVQDMYNPTPEMERVNEIEIHAPVPTNPLTLEVIEEAGASIEDVIGWPHSGRRWATIEEIADHVQPVATDNLTRYITRNKHDWKGYAVGALASEQAQYALGCLEGEDQVQFDYTVQAHATHTMLNAGYKFHPLTGPTKIQLFADHLDYLERTGHYPAMKELLQFARDNNINLYSGRLLREILVEERRAGGA